MGDQQDQEQKINLDDFATMVGFPSELIKKELFQANKDIDTDNLSMDQLRSAMLKYLDSTMFDK